MILDFDASQSTREAVRETTPRQLWPVVSDFEHFTRGVGLIIPSFSFYSDSLL